MSLNQFLAKRLMAQIPVRARIKKDGVDLATGGAGPGGGGGEPTLNSSVFANYKAVTFPGLVILISAVWSGLQLLGTALSSLWVPLGLSVVLGGYLTYIEVSEDQVASKKQKGFGAIVGFCNCVVLFSAVAGGPAIAEKVRAASSASPPASKAAVVPGKAAPVAK